MSAPAPTEIPRRGGSPSRRLLRDLHPKTQGRRQAAQIVDPGDDRECQRRRPRRPEGSLDAACHDQAKPHTSTAPMSAMPPPRGVGLRGMTAHWAGRAPHDAATPGSAHRHPEHDSTAATPAVPASRINRAWPLINAGRSKANNYEGTCAIGASDWAVTSTLATSDPAGPWFRRTVP